MTALAERRWFDPSLPYDKSIHMTQARVLWMLLSRDGAPALHVKFSECVSLADEARRYAAAVAAFPGRLAPMVGCAQHDGVDIIACEAVNYRVLDPQALAGERRSPAVLADLAGHFEAAALACSALGERDIGNEALVDTLRQYFDAQPNAALARDLLDADRAALVRELPNVPQHGDFVLNNLGNTAQGLVIFDWEDYGLLRLPGLDLYTLLLSIAWATGRSIEALQHEGHPLRALIQPACAALGLSREHFETLAPVYALSFRYLKRQYGAVVRQHLDGLIEGLRPAQARP